MDGQIPGYETPVHRALTESILMGGAPRSIAILNGKASLRTPKRHTAACQRSARGWAEPWVPLACSVVSLAFRRKRAL